MTVRDERKRTLGVEQLGAQRVSELPAREVLSLVNANLALPINAALSANVLSDGAVAYSNAQQVAPVDQGTLVSGLPTV
jgi:hypothetical protein